MTILFRWLGVAMLLSGAAFFLSDYHNDVYRKMLLWVTLALGYNFLFGIGGQVSFSHFAFYGVGAYSIVIFLFQLHLPFPLAVLLGIALCVLVALAVAIPSTRLEGFYLALATLALAQLFVVVLNEGGAVTGGTGGLANYRLPEVFARHPELQKVTQLTLWQSLRCITLTLWDEREQKLVPFSWLRRRPAAAPQAQGAQ